MALDVVLMRHGPAAPSGPEGDNQRPLTEDGRFVVRGAAAGLRSLVPGVERILCSPLLRTQQTAEVITEILGLGAAPSACEALTSGSGPEGMFEEIVVHRDAKVVIAVGHMPDLSSLVRYMVGAAGGFVSFKPGGAALVHFDAVKPTEGVLRWQYTPEELTSIGRGEEPRGEGAASVRR